MARSQLFRAVSKLPSASAAALRSLLISAVLVHSRSQELSPATAIRLAVSQHSETVDPPSWAAASNRMNSSERSSRSGQWTHPSRLNSNFIVEDAGALNI